MSSSFVSIKRSLLEAIKYAKTDATKEEVILWLDVDVVEKFKASRGDGCQTCINDA